MRSGARSLRRSRSNGEIEDNSELRAELTGPSLQSSLRHSVRRTFCLREYCTNLLTSLAAALSTDCNRIMKHWTYQWKEFCSFATEPTKWRETRQQNRLDDGTLYAAYLTQSCKAWTQFLIRYVSFWHGTFNVYLGHEILCRHDNIRADEMCIIRDKLLLTIWSAQKMLQFWRYSVTIKAPRSSA